MEKKTNRLLTPEFLAKLANYPLYSQETKHAPELMAVAAFKIGSLVWYIAEGNEEGDRFTFYGLACGMSQTPELGYIDAEEMASVEINGEKYGYPSGTVFRVEPLEGFTPCKLSEIDRDDVRRFCERMNREEED